MEYISVSLLINNTLSVTGYYYITLEQYNYINIWYTEFRNSIIIEELIIDPMNFEIDHIKPNEYLTLFLSIYGNPFPILENIPELEHVFADIKSKRNNDVDNLDEIYLLNELDDIELYTETENISKLIHAHVTGDIKAVHKLLPKMKTDDSIVSQIREKDEYK